MRLGCCRAKAPIGLQTFPRGLSTNSAASQKGDEEKSVTPDFSSGFMTGLQNRSSRPSPCHGLSLASRVCEDLLERLRLQGRPWTVCRRTWCSSVCPPDSPNPSGRLCCPRPTEPRRAWHRESALLRRRFIVIVCKLGSGMAARSQPN